MTDLIPSFDWERVVVDPWTTHMPGTLWMVLMALVIGIPCALLGNYLLLRRLALVGDAISHSVLPGLVLAFLVFRDLGAGYMLAGAMVAGLVTTLLIEFITAKSRLKSDAATGITYTVLFALGLYLVNHYTGLTDLDADCVLFGQLEYIVLEEPSALRLGTWGAVPLPILISAGIAAAVFIYIACFYKELALTSFDPGLARTTGVPTGLVHYSLMAMLSFVVVTALESVGILVVALLVLPGSTAQFFTRRLGRLHVLAVLCCILSVLLGFHLAAWWRCPTASAIALCGGAQFAFAWFVTALPGLWHRLGARSVGTAPPLSGR